MDYILGASSPADTELLDKLSLTDGEFVDRLKAVENDLVDAYVRGELSAGLRDRFSSHYLASPTRREKVKVAESFLKLADREALANAKQNAFVTSGHARLIQPRPSRPSFFARPLFQWGLAAAALVVLLAGGYLLFDNLRLRNRIAETQTQRAALEQREQELQRQLSDQRSAGEKTTQELAQVREELAQLEQSQQGSQSQK